MKKNVVTLNLNYNPDIVKLTRPLIQRWAKKIDAEYIEITKRAFHDSWPLIVEKFQIADIARDTHADWSIYIDLDTAVKPEFFDFTAHLNKDTVSCFKTELATLKYRMDDVFLRDGRFLGIGGFFTACSDWCLDFWELPDEVEPEKLMEQIVPTAEEGKAWIEQRHLVEEYILSRNLAKYGLKFKSVLQLQKELGIPNTNYVMHWYYETDDRKVEKLRELVAAWGV